jgi:hypothetical protein
VRAMARLEKMISVWPNESFSKAKVRQGLENGAVPSGQPPSKHCELGLVSYKAARAQVMSLQFPNTHSRFQARTNPDCR